MEVFDKVLVLEVWRQLLKREVRIPVAQQARDNRRWKNVVGEWYIASRLKLLGNTQAREQLIWYKFRPS